MTGNGHSAQCFLFFHHQLLLLLYLHHPPPHHLNSKLENIFSPNLSLVNFGQVIFQTRRLKSEKRHVPTLDNQSRAKVEWRPRLLASYPVCRGKACGFCSFSSCIHFLSLTISHLYIMHADHSHTPHSTLFFPARTFLLLNSTPHVSFWDTVRLISIACTSMAKELFIAASAISQRLCH